MSYGHPDKQSGFTPSDHPEWVGQLFLFWPLSVETVNFKRPDGTDDPTDMVQADVAIITLMDNETGRPKFLEGARIGGKALTPQIKKQVGGKVLGRLKQSPRQGEKSGAYYLDDWTDADAALAAQYEAAFPHNPNLPAQPSGAAANGNGSGGQPAWQTQQQAPPPQAPPWGQQQLPAGGPPPSQAPAPQANGAAWGQQQAPAAAWNAPAAAPAPQAAAPAPAAPGPETWPPGLADFLQSKQVDITNMTEGTARQIAATYSG